MIIPPFLTGTGGEQPDNFTLGVDVSIWNAEVDWGKMASRGVKFGILKATDWGSESHKGFVDERAVQNYHGMKANGILTGAYCWLDPRYDGVLQADFYLDNFYNKYKTDLPPCLDFEDGNVISWPDMLKKAKAWLERVEQRTMRIPIVYTGAGYMAHFNQADAAFLVRYPLWVAHYVQRTYPTIPKVWQDWTIWQYSSSGHHPYYIYKDPLPSRGKEWGSGSYSLDMNYYKGTLEQLRAFCELEPAVPSEPPLSNLYWPCLEKWRITQHFGERPAQYPTSKGHNGVDFGTPVGSDIYAAWDGVVEVAREDKTGYGRHVRIRHKHGLTIYGHLSKLLVGVGDVIKAKQLIGLSGGATSDPYAGMSTGPHLHFEYRWDVPAPQVPGGFVYNAVDPLPLLISHEEVGMLYKVKIIVGALNVRVGPGVGYGAVGLVYENNELAVYEEKDGWLRIGAGRWISGSTKYILKLGGEPTLTIEERLDDLEQRVDNLEKAAH